MHSYEKQQQQQKDVNEKNEANTVKHVAFFMILPQIGDIFILIVRDFVITLHVTDMRV